ncbi:MAG: tRNA 2-thiouridine(34) synthase MnmA [Pseudomonadales bacterium]|nr:tRNA 2-thiouridine(34) synthase MnmA [Pseudomonadales bacterium]
MPKPTVIVGMSGGVDSSVAASLLIDAGYSVEGLFMKNWDEDDGTEYCTAIEDLNDAEAVCQYLNIKLHTANFAAEYWDHVFEEFLAEYSRGRTPNPDVLCNREIKFKQFSAYADLLGADFIATGHYVKIDHDGPTLSKAADPSKDQSYFLQAVPKQALQNCLFPLGDWLKDDVRNFATERGLHNAKRKDSTGICFIGERRFADFIHQYLSRKPGQIRDPQGRTLGEHHGLHAFTIGQRQGIAIGGLKGRAERPWYVAEKDSDSNQLIVTQEQLTLTSKWLRAASPNWLEEVVYPLRCTAKVRYRQDDQDCTVRAAADGSLVVTFEIPQRAIAPGQFIAFYDQDTMLGGARIESREINAALTTSP